MSIVNIALPDDLQSYVERQAQERGFESCSEYIRDLIQRDLDREKLRALVLEGIASGPAVVADETYFDSLRDRIRENDLR